jgi:DNA-binding winged helix-turn-helix (wHTH) protein/class 3 adenylate cyclase
MLSRDTGETVPLTRGEFALLRFLASHPRRILSRDMLLDATAGRGFEPFDRSVDVMVGRLRRKIEPDPKAPRLIVTVPGGYQFAALLRAHPNRSKTFLIVLSGRESDIRGGATRQSGERMKMPASSDIFLFGQFRLDRAGGGMFRRDDRGVFVPVTIGARALDLLAALIERGGAVVSKEEIVAAVWPKMAVEEGNLFVQISALRAILDREQSGQSCIQTVTGRGYRFIAPVTRCAGGMESHTSPGPHEGFPIFPPDSAKPPVPIAKARSPEPQPSSISSAELRQLTVMVCELVGPAAVSSRPDPEDLREVIAAFRRVVAKIVAGFDGFVGKYMGEYVGEVVLVYFGYPTAQENDAERAVRAALAIQRALSEHNSEKVNKGAPELSARIGLDCGLVVVDSTGEVFGDAPNVAARVLTAAEPGTVLVTTDVLRQVSGLFVTTLVLLAQSGARQSRARARADA